MLLTHALSGRTQGVPTVTGIAHTTCNGPPRNPPPVPQRVAPRFLPHNLPKSEPRPRPARVFRPTRPEPQNPKPSTRGERTARRSRRGPSCLLPARWLTDEGRSPSPNFHEPDTPGSNRLALTCRKTATPGGRYLSPPTGTTPHPAAHNHASHRRNRIQSKHLPPANFLQPAASIVRIKEPTQGATPWGLGPKVCRQRDAYPHTLSKASRCGTQRITHA